jgi:SAM-dependent methyltransferase
LSLPPLTFNAWLRYDLIEDELDRAGRFASVLEIGTGEGAMGTRLARRFTYVGVELDPRSFEMARARIQDPGYGTVLQGDLSVVRPGQEFDVVCAFEVLEHIEDDVSALTEWRDRVRSGGMILISVPAYQQRFSWGDRKAGHYRRYEPDRIRDLLLSVGFTHPVVRTYGFPLGYPLEWTRNALAKQGARGSKRDQTSASGRWLQPPERLGGATKVITAPFRVLQRPFIGGTMGTGLVVSARRD